MGPAVAMVEAPTGNSDSLSIPKLRDDGSNWVDYMDKVRTALGSRGLLRHVDGTATKPMPFKVDPKGLLKPDGSVATDEEIDAKEARIAEYERKEYMAQHILKSTLPIRLVALTRSKNASSIWTAIKDDATKRDVVYQVEIRRKMLALRCDDGSDMKAHLTKLSELKDELLTIGSKITDEEYTEIIILSVPPSFRTVITTAAESARYAGKTLTPEDVTKTILREISYREFDKEKDDKTSETAMAAKDKKKGDKGKGKSDIECFNCKKKGHRRSKCFAEGGGMEGQGPKQKKKAEAASKAADANSKTGQPGSNGQNPSKPAKTAAPDKDQFAFASITCEVEDVDSDQEVEERCSAVTHHADVCAVLDSGSTSHCSPDRESFVTYRKISPLEILVADGRRIDAIGIGDIKQVLPNGSTTTEVTLKNTLHVPHMSTVLISVSKMDKAGFYTLFGGGKCRIKAPTDQVIGEVPLMHGMYSIGAGFKAGQRANTAIQKLSLTEAHRVMGHVAHNSVKNAIRSGVVTGIELDDTKDPDFCEACAKAKAHRKPFPQQATNRASELGERIHMDMWGPAQVETIGRKKYYLEFTDDAHRWSEVDFLAKKGQSLDSYKTFENRLETQDNAKIKILRCDRAGEFLSPEFRDHLNSKGTKYELTVHDTHEQLGVAERANRTVLELARAMLLDAGLPRFLWDEAVRHAFWIKNRSPTRALNGRTPYEAKYRKVPDMSKVVPFGTRTWVKIVDAGKLDPRAKLGFFVGFDHESTGYRIFYADKRRVNVEREVAFHRVGMDASVIINAPDDDPFQTRGGVQNAPLPAVPAAPVQPAVPDEPDNRREIEVERGEVDEAGDADLDPAEPDQPRGRQRRQAAIHDEGYYRRLAGGTRANLVEVSGYGTGPDFGISDHGFQHYALASALETSPATFRQALKGPNAQEWQNAWDDELSQLIRLGTWKIVPRPKDKPVIPHGIVLREKPGSDGQIIRRKVRLVAGGHKQEKGINYEETFASAAKINSIRIILAIAAQRDWEVDQIDVVAAYLNSDLEEEVYMEPPPGALAKNQEGMVCRLMKALYGLKQAGRAWYKKMLKDFLQMGFTVSTSDQSVFIRKKSGGVLVVSVSTDDMTVSGGDRKSIQDFKKEIGKRFTITDGGPLTWFLGLEVKRNRDERVIALNQKGYIEAMAARFGLTDAKPAYTPLESGAVLSKDQEPDDPINVPYQEACGHVLWPAIMTRPDVQFAIGLLARFTKNPAQAHWTALKRLIRYLYTTRDLWLHLGGKEHIIEGFTDSDWASQLDRHSISGYVFRIGTGAVTWSSKRQTLIALSTTEAEYIAVSHVLKEVIWVQVFIKELDYEILGIFPLRCDNQSAIALCRDSKFHARTKHIDIRYHFIREAVNDGKVEVHYVPSEENLADVMTKGLGRVKFEKFVRGLGLRLFA